MTTEGVVQQLVVSIQGHKLIVPVYLLAMSGVDLILGSSWLATLGPHIADYATSTIKVFQHDKFVILKGDENPQKAQLHQLRRVHQTQAITECFTIQLVQPEEQTKNVLQFPADISPDLAALLHKYQ